MVDTLHQEPLSGYDVEGFAPEPPPLPAETPI